MPETQNKFRFPSPPLPSPSHLPLSHKPHTPNNLPSSPPSQYRKTQTPRSRIHTSKEGPLTAHEGPRHPEAVLMPRAAHVAPPHPLPHKAQGGLRGPSLRSSAGQCRYLPTRTYRRSFIVINSHYITPRSCVCLSVCLCPCLLSNHIHVRNF